MGIASGSEKTGSKRMTIQCLSSLKMGLCLAGEEQTLDIFYKIFNFNVVFNRQEQNGYKTVKRIVEKEDTQPQVSGGAIPWLQHI